MRSNHILFLATLCATSFAQAAPLTLECTVTKRTCVNGLPSKNEVHTIREKMGKTGGMGSVVTDDGRFEVRAYGILEHRGAKRPKSSVLVYDSKTQSGAQAGGVALGSPASPRSEIVYVYDATLSDDSDASLCRAIEASCNLH